MAHSARAVMAWQQAGRAVGALMALKATVFKADIQVADMDRHHYADYSLTSRVTFRDRRAHDGAPARSSPTRRRSASRCR